jgi:hypothetical protein
MTSGPPRAPCKKAPPNSTSGWALGEHPSMATDGTANEATGATNPLQPLKSPEARVPVSLSEFLETRPPGTQATIGGIVGAATRRSPGMEFITTDIQLHCPSTKCGGVRIFHLLRDSISDIEPTWELRFLTYRCRNCEKSSRVFALRTRATEGDAGEVEKIGELPSFGPPLPSRVNSLIGPDRDLFLKGRRAENHGLGVGAFAYYRRVVDRQWQRLVLEIIRVSEVIGAPSSMVATLQQAAKETQFSKAVDQIKDGIPEVLKIKGHNPLTLLYAALSDGLHDATDAHCLELAGSVRVVLSELADRIGQALKDESELNVAVTRLLTKRTDP